jgi:hypothetical protein
MCSLIAAELALCKSRAPQLVSNRCLAGNMSKYGRSVATGRHPGISIILAPSAQLLIEHCNLNESKLVRSGRAA